MLAQDKVDRNFMIARGNWYADYADPTTFLHCHTGGDGNNDSGYSNARYDELIAEAAITTERHRRFQLLSEAEAILVEEDCPILPILHYSQMIAAKPYVRGLEPNPRLWFPFQYVTIER
jgi:oligopeptide transport system substrate-binding protein